MAKTLVYEMYPIAWESLPKMTEHLMAVRQLGVDYVWLAPLYPSPRCDHGYDVSDYRAIDQRFGTMQDFEQFIRTAHALGIKVLMDLVLNHTSVEHEWFKKFPEVYCWRDQDLPGWRNLFDHGSAWAPGSHGYYLHLFHKGQADLKWFFSNGEINAWLVHEFQGIVQFWLSRGVDGFRLDVPQAINKDIYSEQLKFEELLFGQDSVKVINAIFNDCTARLLTKSHQPPFLIMECLDPTFGEIVNFYANTTPVNFCLNISIKDAIKGGFTELSLKVDEATIDHNLMLDLESHDSPRFTSRSGLSHADILDLMFGSDAKGICLYQGQELGLLNPSRDQLPDATMVFLDAETKMKFENGVKLDTLRPDSRANARVPYPTATRDAQMAQADSAFWQTAAAIHVWKGDIS